MCLNELERETKKLLILFYGLANNLTFVKKYTHVYTVACNLQHYIKEKSSPLNNRK